MKRIFLVVLLFLATNYKVVAQFDALFTQYGQMMNYYNPAVAGSTDFMRLNVAAKMQWLGFKNAPIGFLVNGEMPLKFFGRKHGVGLSLFSEGLGLFDNLTLGGQYAYQLKLWGGTLGIGVQPGFFSQTFDGTKAVPPEGEGGSKDDEAIPTTKVDAMAFDMNMGVFYNSPTIYGGMSVMHLSEPSIKLTNKYGTFIARSYYLTLGYNIRFKESLFELHPSAFLKTTFQFYALDVQAKLVYNKMFWGGLNWRMNMRNDAVSLFLGAKFGNIKFGYAYDLPISMVLKGSSGSHEVFLSYEMDVSTPKGTKNKHKSIRIL